MLAINNLSTKLTEHRSEILDAIARVIDRGWLVLGPEVRAFEQEFSAYVGMPYCVSVANGTDAIEIGLRALGITHQHKVINVANAGMYSTIAIRAIGALPFFVDVDCHTQLATFDQISKAIEAGANAVILTHLYGRAIDDTEAIVDLCVSKGIPVLEDCAQAHGAAINGRKVGSFGDAAAFSFYPTKNLGAIGDGGAIVTRNAQVAERAERLRQYGWTKKYRSEIAGGMNSRLDELQAAVLRHFLPLLDQQNDRRREIGKRYSAGISHPKVVAQSPGENDDVVHLYVLRCSNRDRLKTWLLEHDIGSDIHYPVPDHLQQSMRDLPKQSLPATEQLANEILTLPCYPELTDHEVDLVIQTINRWPG